MQSSAFNPGLFNEINSLFKSGAYNFHVNIVYCYKQYVYVPVYLHVDIYISHQIKGMEYFGWQEKWEKKMRGNKKAMHVKSLDFYFLPGKCK